MAIRETATDIASSGMAWLAAAVGLSLNGSEFAGGVCLALAGASIAWGNTDATARKPFWWAVGSALFCAIIAQGFAEMNNWGFAGPLFMGAVGFGARFIISVLFKIGGNVEGSTDKLTERLIDYFLPGKK